MISVNDRLEVQHCAGIRLMFTLCGRFAVLFVIPGAVG